MNKILLAVILFLNAFTKPAEGQSDSSFFKELIISFDPVSVCFGEYSLYGEYFIKPTKSFYVSAGLVIPYSDYKVSGNNLLDIPSPYIYKGEVFRFSYLNYKKRNHSYGFRGVNLLGKYMKVDSLYHDPGLFGGSFYSATDENRKLVVGKLQYVTGRKYEWGHFSLDIFLAPGIVIYNEHVQTYYVTTWYARYAADFIDNHIIASPSLYFGARLGLVVKKWKKEY